MDRGDTFYSFISKYPNAEEETFEAGDRKFSLMAGLIFDCVDEVFLGVYAKDGSLKSEQRFDEQTLRTNMQVLRVVPEDALRFVKAAALNRVR